MKANELMIGDWVLDKAVSDKPVQVLQINDKYVHYKHGTDYMSAGVELLEPIPLTPEILEKNGFHKEWDEDIILMVCDTIIVEIGDRYKLYKDGKMYLRRVLSPLYYVHQLQHALRLCGIDKTIEL